MSFSYLFFYRLVHCGSFIYLFDIQRDIPPSDGQCVRCSEGKNELDTAQQSKKRKKKKHLSLNYDSALGQAFILPGLSFLICEMGTLIPLLYLKHVAHGRGSRKSGYVFTPCHKRVQPPALQLTGEADLRQVVYPLLTSTPRSTWTVTALQEILHIDFS